MAEAATKKKQYHLGTGRRKTSVARVRLHDGTGKITINGRSLEEFFTEDKDRNAVVGPLLVTEMNNRLDMIVKVQGGGITGRPGRFVTPPDNMKAMTSALSASIG